MGMDASSWFTAWSGSVLSDSVQTEEKEGSIMLSFVLQDDDEDGDSEAGCASIDGWWSSFHGKKEMWFVINVGTYWVFLLTNIRHSLL